MDLWGVPPDTGWTEKEQSQIVTENLMFEIYETNNVGLESLTPTGST